MSFGTWTLFGLNLGAAVVPSVPTTMRHRPPGSLPLPVIDAEKGRLPTGRNAAVKLTRDAARQEAAWKFIAFATGPRGQEFMTRGTG